MLKGLEVHCWDLLVCPVHQILTSCCLYHDKIWVGKPIRNSEHGHFMQCCKQFQGSRWRGRSLLLLCHDLVLVMGTDECHV